MFSDIFFWSDFFGCFFWPVFGEARGRLLGGVWGAGAPPVKVNFPKVPIAKGTIWALPSCFGGLPKGGFAKGGPWKIDLNWGGSRPPRPPLKVGLRPPQKPTKKTAKKIRPKISGQKKIGRFILCFWTFFWPYFFGCFFWPVFGEAGGPPPQLRSIFQDPLWKKKPLGVPESSKQKQ